MSTKHCLLITFSFLFSTSCTNVREIAKGNLAEKESYSFFFYKYVHVTANSPKIFTDCKVFMSHIKNPDKKLKENIFWYGCDTILPIKFFVTTDTVNGHFKTNFLIADTSTNYLVPVTENERTVFEITNKYLVKEGYPTFAIKGFKFLSRQDSLKSLPFLKTTLQYYKR